MRAIVIEKFGGPECLALKELPEPEPMAGHVAIKVKAFGINHAEMLRRGEWAEAAEVTGIECVGLVKAAPGGEFPVGAKVAALMGGLGRTINGSYADYIRAPASNVVLIESNLRWEERAAIPETYATAWTCLCRNLEIAGEQTLVIRGATSSFGRAAINLAVNAGVRVIATTRNRERFDVLEKLGTDRVEFKGPGLSQRIAEAKQRDAVLDLVGNSTILDSLVMLRRGGRACLAGWLGGLDPIHDFNPLLQMASGVYLTFFGSFVFGTPGFPLSDVPLQTIAEQVEAGRFPAKPSRVFRFEEIREAHRVKEANEALAKWWWLSMLDAPGGEVGRQVCSRACGADFAGIPRAVRRLDLRADEPDRPQATPVFDRQRLVVVVGGSSGMGRQTAAEVVAAGGGAVIIGRDPGGVDDTVETPAKEG